MLTGLYSAATAMESSTRQHEAVAQNLAHAQMPGYRRVVLQQQTFESAFSDQVQQQSGPSRLGAAAVDVAIDFSQGPLIPTGGKLDMALEGDGFFVIEGPNGPLYTRNGAFHLSDAGDLVTADGLKVRGRSGSLTISPEVSVADLTVQPDGTLRVGPIVLGQLEIVQFEDPQKLQRQGITLFSAPEDVMPEKSDSIVHQATLEKANVSPIQELVMMIAAQRQHEAAQRSINQISEVVQRHINQQSGS